MKKLLILLVVAGIVISAAFFLKDDAETGMQNTPKNTTTDFTPDPSNAAFTFDGDATTLSNGRGESEDEEGNVVEAVLLEEQGSGDLNGDGKDDTVVLLARTGGGSGVFIYAAAYMSGPVSYKGTNAIYVGDRVSPQSITVRNGVATLNYLDRSPDEAFASEPTVPATMEFVYRNGEFQER